MDTKIQELTDKIYREGVEKGNTEAERIISEANERKENILKEAESEAKGIVAAAVRHLRLVKPVFYFLPAFLSRAGLRKALRKNTGALVRG